MIALNNPADAEMVVMIRALLDAFVAEPTRFAEWECDFIAAMWRLTRSMTDGTPVFDGARAVWIRGLHARIAP